MEEAQAPLGNYELRIGHPLTMVSISMLRRAMVRSKPAHTMHLLDGKGVIVSAMPMQLQDLLIADRTKSTVMPLPASF